MTYYFLKNYNNYFNRIVKKHDNIEDYLEEVKTYETYTDNDISFNPRDYINAGISHLSWLATLTWKPNYMIEVNDSKKIVRRWFVTNFNFVSNTELYNVELRRDVLVDYNDSIMNSPCFVQKGHLTRLNPLFYNKEDFNCNQIPHEDYEICDESYCSWMVIYYDKKKKAELDDSHAGTIKLNYINAIELSAATIDDWNIVSNYSGSNYYVYLDDTSESYRRCCWEWLYLNSNHVPVTERFVLMKNWRVWPGHTILGKYGSLDPENPPLSNHFFYGEHLYTSKTYEEAMDGWDPVITASLDAAGVNAERMNWHGDADNVSLTDFLAWNDKIVKTQDNKYYRITVNPIAKQWRNWNQPPLWKAALKTAIQNSGNADLNTVYNLQDERMNIYYQGTGPTYQVSYQEISGSQLEFDWNFTQARTDDSVPYGCIAIPYKNLRYLNINDYHLNATPALATLLMASLGSSIYDIQILPFCPLLGVWHDNEDALQIDDNDYGYVNPDTASPGQPWDYTWIYRHGTSTKDIPILFPHDINLIKTFNYNPPQVRAVVYEEDLKLANQCEYFSLVSPSWDTQFDYSHARGGSVEVFTIQQTLKPYLPYIKVCPQFTNLYGQSFNDGRGIICTNNFTYTQINNAWAEYKLQNMNYQAAFDRQIQSMDVTYETNRNLTKKNLDITTSMGLAGGALGVAGGIASGNVLGVAGGGLSIGGVITNRMKTENSLAAQKTLYNEQRQYAIDQHNYDLQNIKARPNTLTKVDALNPTNRTFPVLTRYMCTDEEANIFKDKIKYEGMTLNCMGTLLSYTDEENLTFVKGQLIRLENFEEDSHMANYIASEVAQGFFC